MDYFNGTLSGPMAAKNLVYSIRTACCAFNKSFSDYCTRRHHLMETRLLGFLTRLYFTTIFLPGYIYYVDDLGRKIQDSGIENEAKETQLILFSV